MKSEVFQTELNHIADEGIRIFTKKALENLPDYFYLVSASSTGKYHPAYGLGEGGLVRHTKGAVRFACHLLELEQYRNQFSSRERDFIVAALILHDGWKYGKEEGRYTVFEHPIICEEWIRSSPDLDHLISREDRLQIAKAVASHMGEWNRSSKSRLQLEKPATQLQQFVHMCDYLASRKDLEVNLEDGRENSSSHCRLKGGESSIPNSPKKDEKNGLIEEYVLNFGKYKGQLLVDVFRTNRGYIRWMSEKMTLWEPLKTYVDRLLEEG